MGSTVNIKIAERAEFVKLDKMFNDNFSNNKYTDVC